MPKIPLEEYIEHLQTLNLEGTIKSLMDEAGKAEAAIKNLEKQLREEKEFIHTILNGYMVRTREQLNKHIETTHQEIYNDLKELRTTVIKHISAHQAVMEAKEAGECQK